MGPSQDAFAQQLKRIVIQRVALRSTPVINPDALVNVCDGLAGRVAGRLA